jgi:hypothetical protein
MQLVKDKYLSASWEICRFANPDRRSFYGGKLMHKLGVFVGNNERRGDEVINWPVNTLASMQISGKLILAGNSTTFRKVVQFLMRFCSMVGMMVLVSGEMRIERVNHVPTNFGSFEALGLPPKIPDFLIVLFRSPSPTFCIQNTANYRGALFRHAINQLARRRILCHGA